MMFKIMLGLRFRWVGRRWRPKSTAQIFLPETSDKSVGMYYKYASGDE